MANMGPIKFLVLFDLADNFSMVSDDGQDDAEGQYKLFSVCSKNKENLIATMAEVRERLAHLKRTDPSNKALKVRFGFYFLVLHPL